MQFLPKINEALVGYLSLVLSLLLNIEFDHNFFLPCILTTNMLVLILTYFFTRKIKNHGLLSIAIIASIFSLIGQFYFEIKIITLIGNIGLSIACFGNLILFQKKLYEK